MKLRQLIRDEFLTESRPYTKRHSSISTHNMDAIVDLLSDGNPKNERDFINRVQKSTVRRKFDESSLKVIWDLWVKLSDRQKQQLIGYGDLDSWLLNNGLDTEH